MTTEVLAAAFERAATVPKEDRMSKPVPHNPIPGELVPVDGPVVEAKVKTSAAAAAAAAFVLSLLQLYVFKGGGEVPAALEVMVTTVVTTVVTGGLTFAVGWLTRHTPRWLGRIDAE